MTELDRQHTTEGISPIATYREWRMDRKCDFELYPDSIRAAGRHAWKVRDHDYAEHTQSKFRSALGLR